MANPVLARDTFLEAHATAGASVMTVRGTVLKTALLMLVTAAVAAAVWLTTDATATSLPTSITVAAIAGLVLAITTVVKPAWSPVTAPLYAIVEGLLLGGLTWLIARTPAGRVLAIEALVLTFLVAGMVLTLYATRIIRVTDRLRGVITGATLAIVGYYLLALLLGFAGVRLPFLHDGGWLSIGFSVLVCGVAASNFLLDFAMIEEASAAGAPSYLEWYGAFGVLVTFIWLYLEILRLLGKLQRR